MSDTEQETHVARAVETGIRLGAIALLAIWVFDIIQPFVSPALWGIIIAVAGYPAYRRLVGWCGGREKLAAVIFSLLGVLLLVTPSVMLTRALANGVQHLASDVEDGSVEIPPPPDGARHWPVVGEKVHQLWGEAHDNLEEALRSVAPQIKTLSTWLLRSAASAGAALLQFVLSILIAGGVLANAEAGSQLAQRLCLRLAPQSGAGFATLAEQTVRSVATGVVGVAIIQSALAGVGFVAAGVPGSAFLVLLVLLVAVVQLPTAIVMLPVIVWGWTALSPVPAVIFTVWCLAVGLVDNILKPLLLGRGGDAPMLVIFLGALGGFVSAGIIGLFVGAVALVLAWEIITAWLEGPAPSDSTESSPA